MAQIQSGVDATLQTVDPTFKAARATIRPAENLGWFSLGAQSGALTAVAAAGPVFSFRNTGVNTMMLRRFGIGFIETTAFTAAQIVDFGLFFARAFSVSDTGGTAVAMTGNNAKVRTSLATPNGLDVRIAAAAALTAGTRTLDANPLAQLGGFCGAVGQGIPTTPNNMIQHDTGDYPLILAPNEGLVLAVLTTMGAAGVGRLYVNMEFAEVTAF